MTDDWQSCGDISEARAKAQAEQAAAHTPTEPDVPADKKEK